MVPPGVDTDVFVPGDQRAARVRHGFGADERVIVFAGRIQPLKGPDVLLRAAAVLRERQPDERWRIVVVGGLSGVGRVGPHGLAEMAASLGIADLVTFLPPQPRRAAGRAVPGGGRGRRPQLQRVLRSRRARGAGLRHPGGRRRGRRDCGWPSRTGSPASSSTVTTPPTGPPHSPGSPWTGPAATISPAPPGCRPRSSPGTPPRTGLLESYERRPARAAGGGPVTDHRAVVTAALDRGARCRSTRPSRARSC